MGGKDLGHHLHGNGQLRAGVGCLLLLVKVLLGSVQLFLGSFQLLLGRGDGRLPGDNLGHARAHLQNAAGLLSGELLQSLVHSDSAAVQLGEGGFQLLFPGDKLLQVLLGLGNGAVQFFRLHPCGGGHGLGLRNGCHQSLPPGLEL